MDEEGNFLTVKCDYDSMGRRVFKKVISGNGTVTSLQRFIYRGYLQIACVDLTRTAYTYSPYGQVTATGNVTQPIQWSSEMYDDEIKLVYYNYRHYIPFDGRWIGRDKVEEDINKHLFKYINTHN